MQSCDTAQSKYEINVKKLLVRFFVVAYARLDDVELYVDDSIKFEK